MDNTEYNKLLSEIKAVAGGMRELYRHAETEYAPLVNSVIERQSKDPKEIERLLNGMLDFACERHMLMLYRKLCRYYYFIDPVTTASYISAYMDLWDSEEELFTSGYFKKARIPKNK